MQLQGDIGEAVEEGIRENCTEMRDAIAQSIHEQFQSHLENQPYGVSCSECGETLNVAKTTVDSDLDLIIEVEPCKKCLDEAEGV